MSALSRRLLTTAVASACAVALGGQAAAQSGSGRSEPLIASIDVQGNQFLQKATLLFYVSAKPGDRYDELRLREDFRRLWDTGFLEDEALDVQDSPKGKVVLFKVKERRRIQIVDYRGSKALTNTNIEDELKKKEASLRIDSFYDIGKARRVEELIREQLKEKGRPFATVKHDAKNVGGAGVQVSFTIDDGPKAKVRSIDFTGNTVFSDNTLARHLKKVKPGGFWSFGWIGGKSSYTEDKWAEDADNLRDFYLNHGYVNAEIGIPQLAYTEVPANTKPGKGTKFLTLTVPITEGEQYRVGDVKFEGLTVFKEAGVRPLFKLKTGDVYDEKALKKGYEKLRDFYGSQGYFQWTGVTKRNPDPARKVVDVVLSMEEDKRYYVGKIQFTGNDTTRDKVIRREIYLNENELFNTEALKLSIKRINQLGYFKPMEGAPNLTQSELGEDRLDVTFKVEEQNRNQFTFGGGVSGLEGTFINASFSTANFLGLGETFSLAAQNGARTKNYQISINEPYLFDRPITAGIDLYKRRIEYQTFTDVVGYTDDRTGASFVTGLPVGRFTRAFFSYGYEVINLSGLSSKPITLPDPSVPAGVVFDPLTLGGLNHARESRVSPSLVHNTVDNPYTPRAGVRHTLSMVVAGGPLGGNLNYFKPDLETVLYHPVGRKMAFGMRAEGSYIRAYGDTKALPFYQRFFLGGENQIRGVNIRTVGPIKDNVALGGNKFVLFNGEYYFDVIGPLRALLFFDAGQAYLEGQKIRLKDLRTSTGAEVRFIMPVLNVPFRLIYAWNPHRDAFQPRSTFKFAVGTTF